MHNEAMKAQFRSCKGTIKDKKHTIKFVRYKLVHSLKNTFNLLRHTAVYSSNI